MVTTPSAVSATGSAGAADRAGIKDAAGDGGKGETEGFSKPDATTANRPGVHDTAGDRGQAIHTISTSCDTLVPRANHPGVGDITSDKSGGSRYATLCWSGRPLALIVPVLLIPPAIVLTMPLDVAW